MSEGTPPGPVGGTGANRIRRMLPLAAAVGAVSAAAGAVPDWVRQGYGEGEALELSRTGLQVAPALLPLAIVAIAGMAACYASRGVVRRIIAILVGLTGVGVIAATVGVLMDPPRTAANPDYGPPVPEDLLGQLRVQLLGPVLTIVGGTLIIVGGIGLLLRKTVRQLGSRYDSPIRVERGPGGSASAGHSGPADPSDADAAAAWWKALDAGADPTSGPNGRSGPGA